MTFSVVHVLLILRIGPLRKSVTDNFACEVCETLSMSLIFVSISFFSSSFGLGKEVNQGDKASGQQRECPERSRPVPTNY